MAPNVSELFLSLSLSLSLSCILLDGFHSMFNCVLLTLALLLLHKNLKDFTQLILSLSLSLSYSCWWVPLYGLAWAADSPSRDVTTQDLSLSLSLLYS